MGKLGTVVIPPELRRRFGMEEGALVVAEQREDGVLIRPANGLTVEQPGALGSSIKTGTGTVISQSRLFFGRPGSRKQDSK